MSNILIYPILLPFVTAAATLLLWRKPSLQQAVSLVGAVGHLAACVAVFSAVRGGASRYFRWATGLRLMGFRWWRTI